MLQSSVVTDVDAVVAERAAERPGYRPGGTSGKGFMPGRSGNPGGRSRRTSDGRSLAQLCRDYTEDSLRVLHSVVLNENEPTALRVHAAGVILGRGWCDAPRVPEGLLEGVTIVVRSIEGTPEPTPGVICHPDPRFIALPSIPDRDVTGAEGGKPAR
jgi:hypothetical protein